MKSLFFLHVLNTIIEGEAAMCAILL